VTKSGWREGLLYVGVLATIFFIGGMLTGLRISENNNLQFYDFIKVIITIMLTLFILFACMSAIGNYFDREKRR
jgi:hypothetical protein